VSALGAVAAAVVKCLLLDPDYRHITFVPPLGVLYLVEDEDQVISVLPVWVFQTHP